MTSVVASKFLEGGERGLFGKLALPLLMVVAGPIGDEQAACQAERVAAQLLRLACSDAA